ncbi:Acyl-protein thioesterase 1 [Madurella mycetomatis]|uniref:Acyl-protein thioesterase 1 n=1 Tax=Madurella mycetomatis TaxID=100816 RepID=A0A175WJH8_9PEZI|nr:Acyl-protein thioesterase 1 [Madurella mycetomatis]
MPPFGPVHILEPEAEHTHTIILLHGRGSNGEEFAQELLESKLSNGNTLQEQLPTWRWVFPSSTELWSTAFEETMPAWFEAHSLTNVTARQDLQMAGIRDSVQYLTRLLEEETEKLGGAAHRVVLGGISQGGAAAMWTLLCAGDADVARRLGGFVGASTWLPFAENLERYLGGQNRTNSDAQENDAMGDDVTGDDIQVSEADAFVKAMTASARRTPHQRGASEAKRHPVPVFLAHGTYDAYVDIELGRHAACVLRKVGLKISWTEYSGADQEGHWLKEPEEFDDITCFLESISTSI